MDGAYRTLEAETRVEIDKIKGSRFIGTAAPLEDEAGLAPLLETLRAAYPDANHHAWAWRIGERFRYSDDGEPSGTAGRPLLQRLDGRSLDRSVVVVTRIFGGTKLGAGGLVRAYSAAAGAVLEAASIVEVIPRSTVHVRIPYPLVGALESIARRFELEPVDAAYGEDVVLNYRLTASELEPFCEAVREATAGQAELEIEARK